MGDPVRDFIAKWMAENGDWDFDIPPEATATELLEEIARQADARGAGNAMLADFR
jgi:hypothetical protein